MFMRNYLERNLEREKLRVNRFQSKEEKTYFLTVWRSQSVFLAFPARHR